MLYAYNKRFFCQNFGPANYLIFFNWKNTLINPHKIMAILPISTSSLS